jgi:hypothetical protein
LGTGGAVPGLDLLGSEYAMRAASLLLLLICVAFYGCESIPGLRATEDAPLTGDVNVLEKWAGDYPVAELGRLPEGQRGAGIGYIGDAATFAAVWEAFMPSEGEPGVDWLENIVVFSRNTQFYNRTNIFRVTAQDGVAEVMAMETMSAIPIEDKVAMAMAVIPRAGLRAIKVGDGRLEISAD